MHKFTKIHIYQSILVIFIKKNPCWIRQSVYAPNTLLLQCQLQPGLQGTTKTIGGSQPSRFNSFRPQAQAAAPTFLVDHNSSLNSVSFMRWLRVWIFVSSSQFLWSRNIQISNQNKEDNNRLRLISHSRVAVDYPEAHCVRHHLWRDPNILAQGLHQFIW